MGRRTNGSGLGPIVASLAVLSAILLPPAAPSAEGRGETFQRVHIQWHAPAATLLMGLSPERPSASDAILEVRERRRGLFLAPMPGPDQLSREVVVVTGIDATGIERSRIVIPDPRILRTEYPGKAGDRSGTVYYRSEVDLMVTLPDREEIAAVRIYQPRTTNAGPVLDLVGTVPLD